MLLGIGDDAACLQVPPGARLVVAVDTLIEGVHFPVATQPGDIGWKALAVNLSDLAAMGAAPAWFTLALTLPDADEDWLRAFAAGLFELADRFDIELVGGDTTRGSLSITVQVMGVADQVLKRSGAQPGQAILVSGTLGDAALALYQLNRGQTANARLMQRLNRPEPRIELGKGLARLAAAAIDISDGLFTDLGHLLDASGCGATVNLADLPRSGEFVASGHDNSWQLLGGGDDYELCFTADPDRLAEIHQLAAAAGVSVTRIGVIERHAGLRCVNAQGEIEPLQVTGYDHFR